MPTALFIPPASAGGEQTLLALLHAVAAAALAREAASAAAAAAAAAAPTPAPAPAAAGGPPLSQLQSSRARALESARLPREHATLAAAVLDALALAHGRVPPRLARALPRLKDAARVAATL
jgi:hypothetical protein